MTNRLSRILMPVVTLFFLLPLAPRWAQAQDVKPKAGGKPYELRVVHVKANPVTVRFNTETGESWLYVPDALGGVAWTKIKEPNQPPAGNYDVVLSVSKDGANYAAFRIDRVSGKTWTLGATGKDWEEIAEPR
jgi:hypothetical protein